VFLVPVVVVAAWSWIMHTAHPSSSTHTIPWRHITQKYLSTLLQNASSLRHYYMDDHLEKDVFNQWSLDVALLLSWKHLF
jgi:hypothetical protein